MTAALERELKLQAPPSFRLPELRDVAEGVELRPRAPERLHAVYLDTDDLRLIRWGVTLRHRTGEGWTLKLPGGVDSGFLTRNELRLDGDVRRVPAAAADLVRAYARSAPLTPQARLRTLRRVVDFEDADGNPLAQLADDEVSVLDGRRVAARFRELEVEAAETAALDVAERIVELLQAAGAGAADPTPKVARALGPRALESPDVVVGKLPPRATGEDVVRRMLAASVVRLLHHDAIVRLDADLEGVHQARVATRRIRSDLRTFAPLLDTAWAKDLRTELAWLAGLLGRVRDADVMLDRLRARVRAISPETATVAAGPLATLADERSTSFAELLDAMRGERYVALLDRLVEASQCPPVSLRAGGSAAEILPTLVRAPWLSLRKLVASLPDPPTDEDLHGVRIATKRCRYAADAAAPVLGKRATAFAAAAAGLQDALGEHNDAVLAEAWLRAWAGRRRKPAAVFAAGELAGLERAAARRARARWRKAWKALVATKPRTWM